MIRGKKTYITAAVAVVTAVGAWATGEMALAEAIQLSFTAILGACIRNGIIDT